MRERRAVALGHVEEEDAAVGVLFPHDAPEQVLLRLRKGKEGGVLAAQVHGQDKDVQRAVGVPDQGQHREQQPRKDAAVAAVTDGNFGHGFLAGGREPRGGPLPIVCSV